MSEEVVAVEPVVVEEPACTGCEASKKDLDECVLVNGEASCGPILEAYKKCMATVEGTAWNGDEEGDGNRH